MPVDMMYGIVRSGQNDELMHYGRSKRDGAPKGSGRYPLGSGEDPRAPGLDVSDVEKFGNAASETGKQFATVSKFIRAMPKNENNKESNKIDIASMSDAELRTYVNRRVIEEQYKNFYDKEHPAKDHEKAKKFVANMLDYGGAALGMVASSAAIYAALKKAGL